MLSRILGRPEMQQRVMSAAVLDRFMKSGVEYGLSIRDKRDLIKKFQRVTENVPSGTAWLYHVVLATEILNISPKVEGDVIECGCWKGASAASLSLVCEAVSRKLIVCDSFEGLPENNTNVVHSYAHLGKFAHYRSGMFAGRYDEVVNNIEQYGSLESCMFIYGWFAESLKAMDGPIVFGFFDVDLASSMRDCIQWVWPRLVDGGLIYTDDSCDLEVVKTWFDDAWWWEILGQDAPGYVGSGCGLPLTPNYTSLGYARKVVNPKKAFAQVEWEC